MPQKPQKNKCDEIVLQLRWYNILRFSALLLIATSLAACFAVSPVPPAGTQLHFDADYSPAATVQLSAVGVASRSDVSPAAFLSPEQFQGYNLSDEASTALVVEELGDRVFLATREGEVFELRKRSDSPVRQVRKLVTADSPIYSMALSSDGSKLAFSQYSYVGVIDLHTQQLVAQLTIVDGRILQLAWDRGGDLLALGRTNGDVFVWDAKYNNSRSLEQYSSATSPIVGLMFHPKARALFVLERTGGLYLWRVLRTEYQLGLRDETADVDKAQQGRLYVTVGYLPGASELWISSDGEEVLALSPVGQVFSWSVRGLIQSPVIDTGSLHAVTMGGMRAPMTQRTPVLLLGGRGQQLQMRCRAVKPELVQDISTVPIIQEGQALGTLPVAEDPYGILLEEEIDQELEAKKDPGLLLTTPVMESTLVKIRLSRTAAWLAFGDGKLAEIPFSRLFSSAGLEKRLGNCDEVVLPDAEIRDAIPQ